MVENGFSIEINNRFDALMTEGQWRKRTLAQLRKDMRMAGLAMERDGPFKEMEALMQTLSLWVADLRLQPSAFNNLNYRIDLPMQVDVALLDDYELARLYLLRSFHKVWLRDQFSSADRGEGPEEQLKP